jgi:hypothetical protein
MFGDGVHMANGWRRRFAWSSEHPALLGIVTGIVIGLIWFGASYAIDPHEGGASRFLFPVIFGAVIGFGYYMMARVDQG